MEQRKRLQLIGRLIWFILFIWFVLFAWLNDTKETRRTKQTRATYSSFACLLPGRRLITTNRRMVTAKSQRLGLP